MFLNSWPSPYELFKQVFKQFSFGLFFLNKHSYLSSDCRNINGAINLVFMSSILCKENIAIIKAAYTEQWQSTDLDITPKVLRKDHSNKEIFDRNTSRKWKQHTFLKQKGKLTLSNHCHQKASLSCIICHHTFNRSIDHIDNKIVINLLLHHKRVK